MLDFVLEGFGGAVSSSRAAISASPVDRGVFTYTACYCEENVYHLCKSLVHSNLASPDASDLFVAFISNSVKQVPIWRQRSSAYENGLCIWDYHVICIQKHLETDEVFVWDLDTTLPFPVSFIQYIEEALESSMAMNPRYQRLFRIISAPVFLKTFASDRRHMKDRKGGWLTIPPGYDCIEAEDGTTHNLGVYLRMPEHAEPFKDAMLSQLQEKFGLVVSETDFKVLFTTRLLGQ